MMNSFGEICFFTNPNNKFSSINTFLSDLCVCYFNSSQIIIINQNFIKYSRSYKNHSRLKTEKQSNHQHHLYILDKKKWRKRKPINLCQRTKTNLNEGKSHLKFQIIFYKIALLTILSNPLELFTSEFVSFVFLTFDRKH